jgi:hypothetical protein
MKDFKPHDQVVFKTDHLRLPLGFYQEMQPHVNFPIEKEIVTIVKPSPSHAGFFIIREYVVNKRGTMQAISGLCLFPLDEFHAIESEKILAKITQSVYQLKK